MRVRLTAMAASIGVLAGVVSGCTSSGGTTRSSTPPAATTSTASTPTDSPSPSIIGIPTPTSTAVRRAVPTPSGAKVLHGGPCGDAIGAANQILVSIKGPLIAAAQDPPNAGQSRAVMPGVVPYIPKVNRDITKARQQWLAGGYPADSPAVRDIDAMLAALDRLVPLAKAADLNAISKIYLDLNSALDQYVYDSGAFCTQ